MTLFSFNKVAGSDKFCLRITLFIILITGFFLFFVGGPDYYSGRSFKQFWNLGHICFFALFTYVLLTSKTRLSGKSFEQQFLWSILLALGIGLLVEIGQYGPVRNPDTQDLLRNLIGALFALSFLVPGRKLMTPAKRKLAQVIVGVMVFIETVPMGIAVTDEIFGNRQFPELSGLEFPTEILRWRGDTDREIVNTIAKEGNCSLKIQLDTTTYSGVSLSYFPRNWEGYTALQFSAFNPPDEPLKITCRIHDRKHTEGDQKFSDRFNRRFVLKNGWNTIEIPLDDVISAPKTRTMDIADIRNIGIFVTRLSEPKVLYLDGIRLIR